MELNLLGPELKRVIGIALEGVKFMQTPPDPNAVAISLSPFVALVGQAWTEGGRKEFQITAVRALMSYPARLVLPAIEEAKMHLTRGEQLVPFVWKRIEGEVAKLQAEEAMLTRLSNLADQPKD